MNENNINVQIKSKKKQAMKLRKAANQIDHEIRLLKEELTKVCKHPSTKIITQSYEEPGKVKYFEWREKVCKKCGKVLGTSKQKEVWTEFK